jgi:hypothetical protein
LKYRKIEIDQLTISNFCSGVTFIGTAWPRGSTHCLRLIM